MEQKICENLLDKTHEWIRAADQKVSIFVAFQGLVFAILIPDIFIWISKDLYLFSNYNLILILISLVLLIYSILKSINALIPRLNKKSKENSLIYFDDIVKLTLEEYKKSIKEITKEEYLNDLVNQIYVSARIASVKHKQFRDSVVIFTVGSLLLIISYLSFVISNLPYVY